MPPWQGFMRASSTFHWWSYLIWLRKDKMVGWPCYSIQVVGVMCAGVGWIWIDKFYGTEDPERFHDHVIPSTLFAHQKYRVFFPSSFTIIRIIKVFYRYRTCCRFYRKNGKTYIWNSEDFMKNVLTFVSSLHCFATVNVDDMIPRVSCVHNYIWSNNRTTAKKKKLMSKDFFLELV